MAGLVRNRRRKDSVWGTVGRGLAAVVVGLLLVGCGDDDSGAAGAGDTDATATETAPQDRVDRDSPAAPAAGDSAAFEKAPEGTITLEVDGETFSSDIETCQLADEGPIVIQAAPDADPGVGLNLARSGPDRFSVANAGVSTGPAGEAAYVLSATSFDAQVLDRSVVVTSDEFFAPATGKTGLSGTLSATCEP